MQISGKVVDWKAGVSCRGGLEVNRATITPDPVQVSKLKVGDKVLVEATVTGRTESGNINVSYPNWWTIKDPKEIIVLLPSVGKDKLPPEPEEVCTCTYKTLGYLKYANMYACPIHGKPEVKPILSCNKVLSEATIKAIYNDLFKQEVKEEPEEVCLCWDKINHKKMASENCPIHGKQEIPDIAYKSPEQLENRRIVLGYGKPSKECEIESEPKPTQKIEPLLIDEDSKEPLTELILARINQLITAFNKHTEEK